MYLTHAPLDKMDFISQTTLSNAVWWMKTFFISIRITLKIVPKGPVDNKAALVQLMAWSRTADKPLSKPMLT